MAGVKLISQKAMNTVVKDIEGVQLAAYEEAQKIGSKAKGLLAPHHTPERESRIEVKRGDVDSYVLLIDEAALFIERGHTHNESGEWVDGLNVLGRAAGLM